MKSSHVGADNFNDTVIVCGFAGVGKTTFAMQETKLRVVDLESRPFNFSDIEARVVDPAWPRNYLDAIEALRGKVDVILISTHDAVRAELKERNIPFILAYPAPTLKKEYAHRYQTRGGDKRVIESLEKKYDEFIEGMMQETGCTHLVLESGVFLRDAYYTYRSLE